LTSLPLLTWATLTTARAVPAAAAPACGTENLLAGKRPSAAQEVKGDVALVTDGAVGKEGTVWDAPVAITIGTSAGYVAYDLGEVRTVSAIVAQADANDTYKVSGSLDGSPGSYKQLVQLANVVDRGHGLRTRPLEFAPTEVRYIKFGDGDGDGFYSLSEFAAYCKKPTPFPPAMRVVDAPAAQQPAEAPPPAAPKDGGRSVLLLAAAALLLAWLAYRTINRGGGSSGGGPSGGGTAGSGDGGGSVGSVGSSDAGGSPGSGASAAGSGDAGKPAEPNKHTTLTTHDYLRMLFLASGCAALIYEVVWFHLLRLVIGASALSVGIVLAAFMGGMFLGSLLFARYVPRARDPVRVYAMLEIGVGVFGLAMPILLPAVRFIYIGLVGYGPLGIALRAVVAIVLLLPPTALMGATLPAIARRYPPGRRGQAKLSGLYAANTIGAVAGCLLSAFYLLAVWDVWVATIAAAVINFGIGGLGLRLGRVSADPSESEPVPPPAPTGAPARDPRAIYIAAGLSGLTALGAQVVWTRLLTLLFGATVYAFAIILAVFLAGLGIGSALAAYLLRRGQNAVKGLVWSQLGLIPSVFLAAYLLADALPYGSPPSWTPLAALHALHVVRAVDVILPGAIFWGMSFPFALAAANAGSEDTGRTSGHVYAANTVGAILGAIGISFGAIPAYGTQFAQRLLVLGAGLSATILIAAIRQPAALAIGATRRPISPVWPLVACALAAAFLPGLPDMFKAHGRYIWWANQADKYVYVSEGAASTVAVHIAPDGYSNFHVSGRVEATNNPNDLREERLMGHLAGLYHPAPESVLVVGMGAGITTGALSLYPEVKRIVICEIEPRVVGAAQQFTRENYGALTNPKVEIVFDDARHFLATTREKFDIITSDPIHPWVRGNSILFSREYYAIVKDHLKPGGIASQWVPLYETSEAAIKIQMRTFVDAFPDGTVWNTLVSGKGYDVVLVGAAAPLHLDARAIQDRIDRSPQIAQSLRDIKIANATDLLATFAAAGPDMTAWLKGAPVNRDFSLKLEYISGLALNAAEADTIYTHMTAGRAYPAALIAAPPAVEVELRRRLSGDAVR
jgi:spermidine synthase